MAKPVLIANLLQSIRLLADGARVFSQRLQHNVDHALLTVTVLNPVLGYDQVAKITNGRASTASRRVKRPWRWVCLTVWTMTGWWIRL